MMSMPSQVIDIGLRYRGVVCPGGWHSRISSCRRRWLITLGKDARSLTWPSLGLTDNLLQYVVSLYFWAAR